MLLYCNITITITKYHYFDKNINLTLAHVEKDKSVSPNDDLLTLNALRPSEKTFFRCVVHKHIEVICDAAHNDVLRD